MFVQRVWFLVLTRPNWTDRCSSSWTKACLDRPGAITLDSSNEAKTSWSYTVWKPTVPGQYPLFMMSFNSGLQVFVHDGHIIDGRLRSKRPTETKITHPHTTNAFKGTRKGKRIKLKWLRILSFNTVQIFKYITIDCDENYRPPNAYFKNLRVTTAYFFGSPHRQ